MKSAKLYLICLIAASCFACNQNTNISSIPTSPVDIYIDLSIYHTHLNAPNENQYFTKDDINTNTNPNLNIRAVGYGGIIIHTYLGDNGNTGYNAFDMTCPYEIDKQIRVYPDKSGMYAVCEKCGSKFDLSFGQIASEESLAKENLKRHNATRTGNAIRVTQRYD